MAFFSISCAAFMLIVLGRCFPLCHAIPYLLVFLNGRGVLLCKLLFFQGKCGDELLCTVYPLSPPPATPALVQICPQTAVSTALLLYKYLFLLLRRQKQQHVRPPKNNKYGFSVLFSPTINKTKCSDCVASRHGLDATPWSCDASYRRQSGLICWDDTNTCTTADGGTPGLLRQQCGAG